MILVVVEHDRGALAPATLEALTAARAFGAPVAALTIGASGDGLAPELGAYGVSVVHQVHDDLLTDYGPELWGEVIVQAVGSLAPSVVLACGTDRGNEVLAQAAAHLDLPFAANCLSFSPGDVFEVTRVRWGGSLLEDAVVDAPVKLVSLAHHAIDAVAAGAAGSAAPAVESLTVKLDPVLARTLVAERVDRVAGITLSTAPVVVGGGRGVGSADGFAVLEELAAELGGVVGCSRAVTNNGWRSHTDQVGQTGTRIAPDVYFACGISGAIQHWVGMMASKNVLAINTDAEAPMVTKADYAVIGDLHPILDAIVAEVKRRRGL